MLLSSVCYGQEWGERIGASEAAKMVVVDEEESIETDFRMRKKVSLMKEVQESEGRFSYDAATKTLTLDYREPAGNKMVFTASEMIVTTGGKTNRYTLEQNPGLSQIGMMIKACTTGDLGRLTERAETEYYRDGALLTMLVRPNSGRTRKYMREILLRFDVEAGVLRVMRLTEGNGDWQEYEFLSVK